MSTSTTFAEAPLPGSPQPPGSKPAAQRPLLDVHVRRKAFGQRIVLRDFRLSLRAGEVVSLIGSSGCGKSTLLRIIAGLDHEYEGSVRVNGLDRWGTTRDIGFVFQEPRLFPWLDVADNIAFDPDRPSDHRERVETLLREVGLQGLGQRLPKQLSGGQAQRVAIARGLFARPQVLLLDEPFSAVDALTRLKLQELLSTLVREHGVAVLLVTHDVEEAALLSDRVLVLANRAGNTPQELAITLPRPRERSDATLAALRHELLLGLEVTHTI